MDTGSRHETPGSEVKDTILLIAIADALSYHHFSVLVSRDSVPLRDIKEKQRQLYIW